MNIAEVKLEYRQLIGASAQPGFEADVFRDTYAEFRLQAQVYNKGKTLRTFAQMNSADPKADSLNFKVGLAIGLYLKGLGKKIPDFCTTIGTPVCFDEVVTKIVSSDILDSSSHVIALHYTTPSLVLLHSFGEYMVLMKKTKEGDFNDNAETSTIKFQDGLSIVRYKIIESKTTEQIKQIL